MILLDSDTERPLKHRAFSCHTRAHILRHKHSDTDTWSHLDSLIGWSHLDSLIGWSHLKSLKP
jgi:hypothetical protein